jgi:hypothetical protein
MDIWILEYKYSKYTDLDNKKIRWRFSVNKVMSFRVPEMRGSLFQNQTRGCCLFTKGCALLGVVLNCHRFTDWSASSRFKRSCQILILFIHKSPMLFQSLHRTEWIDDLEILRQAMFAVYFTLKFHGVSGGTEENYEESLARIGNRLTKIRIRDISTTQQQYQPLNLRNSQVWRYLTMCFFVYRTHLFSNFSKKIPHIFARLNVFSYDACLQHIRH